MSGGVGVSSDNVEVNVVATENGNVKFTVTLKAGNGGSQIPFSSA